jgi:hypothetical protein
VYLTVYLLLLAPVLLAAVGPRLARNLAPAPAARALAATVPVAVLVAVTVLALADATSALGRFLEILHP